MMQGNLIIAALGFMVATGLFGIGTAFGIRYARRNRLHAGGITENDRERLIRLLGELSQWTSEYSGNVLEYQNQLGRLREAAQQSGSAALPETEIVMLLKQIMASNEQLQTRLNAAEQQLQQQTKQLQSYLTEARTDGLTGLPNRRAFDHQLEELFIAHRNGGGSFVVALVDIDHFKSINDNYGHQIGDQVLQKISSMLRVSLERSMIVARFGGEEFAILMEGPLREAAEACNELRKQIAAAEIHAGQKRLSVTISIGLSEPGDDGVVAPVIRRADEALYAAKNFGRNRVYYHDGRDTALVGAPEVAR